MCIASNMRVLSFRADLVTGDHGGLERIERRISPFPLNPLQFLRDPLVTKSTLTENPL